MVDIYDLMRQQDAARAGARSPLVAVPSPHGGTAYALAALEAETSELAATPEGQRNHRLNVAAFKMGTLVAANLLDADLVRSTLARTARAIGLTEPEIAATIASGGKAGLTRPRDVPDRPPAPGTTVLAPATTDDSEPDRPARTSWWPTDLGPVIDGDETEPPPQVLVRTDGQAMLYPGRVNGLIGPAESGKTWVALHAVAQQLGADSPVTYVDFEDSAAGLVGRLRTLGADMDAARTLLAYVGPDEALGALQSGDLTEHLDAHRPALVVVDGVNAAMTLMALDLMSNTDATAFTQRLLRPIANTGATVVYIDHTPKNDAGAPGGIGAQAKRAMTTGCTLRVEVVEPFGRGQHGRLRLRVDKDRPGHVRGASLPGEGGHWAGDVTITPTGPDTISIEMTEPVPVSQREGFRPTGVMEKVSRMLETMREPVTVRQVERECGGKAAVVREAVNILVDERFAVEEPGPRNARLLRSAAVYRQRTDPRSDRYDGVTTIGGPLTASTASQCVPTASRTHSGDQTSASQTPPPLLPQGGGAGRTRPAGLDDPPDGPPRPDTPPPDPLTLFAPTDPATGLQFDPRTGEVIEQQTGREN